jgi:hypothetical protein
MTSNFDNAALTNREPKARDGRRCRSPFARRGAAEIEAGAARSLPKSDSVGGSRCPGSGGLARDMYLDVREQLVHRSTFLAMPAPGARTTDYPRVFAPAVRRPRLGACKSAGVHRPGWGASQNVQVQMIGVVTPSSPSLESSLLNLVTNLKIVVGLTGSNVVTPSTVLSGGMSARTCG